MGFTTVEVTTPAFGLRRRTVVAAHGAEPWVAVIQKSCAPATLSGAPAFRFVVSGISKKKAEPIIDPAL